MYYHVDIVQEEKNKVHLSTYQHTYMYKLDRLSFVFFLCSKPPNMQKSCSESICRTDVITKPAITFVEFSLTNHTENNSPYVAVVVDPNEAYGVTSAGAQMTVCTTEEEFQSVYQTNVAYGITTPAELSLTCHTEHDPQDVAVDMTPNEAYGVTPAGAQMSACIPERDKPLNP